MVTRSCAICGKDYEVCPTCESVRTFTPWRTLVCCATEFVLFETLSKFDCDKNAVEANDVLKQLDITDIDKYLPHVQKQITDIRSIVAAKSKPKRSAKKANAKTEEDM